MLMRVFLGWLRGERGHCSMVAIPTLEQEDAKRPSRERENLVGEQTRIVNRMKAALVRLGIRGFKPELRKAPQRLTTAAHARGRDDSAKHAGRNSTRHDPASRSPRADRSDRQTRLERLKQAPAEGPNAMVLLLARVIGVGIETADILVQEVLIAEPPRSTCCSALCRAHWLARRERLEATREGACQGRQCTGAPRSYSTRLAVPAVPER